MRKLVFATNNKGKLEEIKQLLQDKFEVLSLADVFFSGEIPEDFETLEENALQKAQFIFSKCKIPTISDDSGLEVEALNGAPGVYSARYAGLENDANKNMDKLLLELKGIENRNAKFKTVIAYVDSETQKTFVGEVQGHILEAKRGEKGFGYDPVFLPDGYSKTFAEMTKDEKNAISHRAKATKKLVKSLLEIKH